MCDDRRLRSMMTMINDSMMTTMTGDGTMLRVVKWSFFFFLKLCNSSLTNLSILFTGDGTILRGVKLALAKLKSSPEFSTKDVRRHVQLHHHIYIQRHL